MMAIMEVHNAGDYGHHQVVMLIMTVYMVVWILEIGSDDSGDDSDCVGVGMW